MDDASCHIDGVLDEWYLPFSVKYNPLNMYFWGLYFAKNKMIKYQKMKNKEKRIKELYDAIKNP